jgi:hypothetical protein
MTHPNYEETRQSFVEFTLKALAKDTPQDVLEGIRPALKARFDEIYTDEVLFHQFQQQAADKRAKEAAYWNEYYVADAAKKAAKANNDKLAQKDAMIMKTRALLEEAEAKVRELNRTLDDGSH